MKYNLLLLFLLLFGYIYAQDNHYSISAQIGPSWRIGEQKTDVIDLPDDYDSQLKNGLSLRFKGLYTFYKKYSIGLLVTNFSSGKASTNISGVDISEERNILFIGPLFEYGIIATAKQRLYGSVGIGYTTYKSNAYVNTNFTKITGNNVGFDIGIGYDYYIMKNLALSTSLNVPFAVITEWEYGDGSKINLKDTFGNNDNLLRIDLNVGITASF